MSTRFYPRFVKGNPQLRIFLPDHKLILLKNNPKIPDNIVTFKTHVTMTNWDIRNYLEKIYKVQVGAVNSVIRAGALKKTQDGIAKWEDYRIAYVTLPMGQTFKWPRLFPEEKSKEQSTDVQRVIEEIDKGRLKDPNVQDVPTWFI